MDEEHHGVIKNDSVEDKFLQLDGSNRGEGAYCMWFVLRRSTMDRSVRGIFLKMVEIITDLLSRDIDDDV